MESRGHPVLILLEHRKLQSATEVFISQALAYRPKQQQLQLPTMDRVLRPFVSGWNPPFLAIDQLTEFVEVTQLLRGETNLGEVVAEVELAELANGGGLEVDADPEGGHVAHGLIHTDRDAGLVQAQRQAESADAASDDDHLHMLRMLARVYKPHGAAARAAESLFTLPRSASL